jgi:hypothetical protein
MEKIGKQLTEFFQKEFPNQQVIYIRWDSDDGEIDVRRSPFSFDELFPEDILAKINADHLPRLDVSWKDLKGHIYILNAIEAMAEDFPGDILFFTIPEYEGVQDVDEDHRQTS